MIDKLNIIKQRFDEVSDLIIQPDIISDQKKYIQINKEYKDRQIKIIKIGQNGKGYNRKFILKDKYFEVLGGSK